MTTPTQVINLILDALVASITAAMKTPIDPTDITYVDVVKKGLLQTDKTKENVQIGITGGDHEDPKYTDGIAALGDLPNIGFYVPNREIGGGEMWWRRGVARLECFYIRERLTEDEAHEAAYNTLGRLMQTIPLTSMSGLTDSFGEHAIKLFCFGNTMFESGGPPKTYIFRGKVLWQALTERPQKLLFLFYKGVLL